VLLLDEPTTYLDIAHQADVLEVVGELRRVLGMTVVLVLHDLNHVAAVADRVLALYEGVALATGTPAELFTPETIHALYGVAAEVAPGVDGGPPRIHLDHRARRDQRTQRTHPDQKERP
jgi:iron complex transport system ATP-binding protein